MVYFERSQPAPESLALEKAKSSSSYKTQEVVERLANDFHNKCYICEQIEPTSINIEHFKAHQGNKDLMFEWDNLFFSCAHCNNVKLNFYNNLLNCTILEDNVETALHYLCDPYPKEKVQIEIIIKSDKAIQTKELLEKTYNGEHTPLKVLESSSLRNLLIKEIKIFQDLVINYLENNKHEVFLLKIEEHLSNRSAFTAFKRWIIRDNKILSIEFERFL